MTFSPEFDTWFSNHQKHCEKNWDESSGAMEVGIATSTILWSRSVRMWGLHYTSFLGDEESNVFKVMTDNNPYGEIHPIKKEKCVNPVLLETMLIGFLAKSHDIYQSKVVW